MKEISPGSVVIIPPELDNLRLDPYQFRVYCRIFRRIQEFGCSESVDSMAEACRIDRKTVFAAIKVLIDHGLITKDSSQKKGGIVTYHLMPPSNWTSVQDHVRDPEQYQFSGIYFLLQCDRVVYVGQSTCVPSRIQAHALSKQKLFDRWNYVSVSTEVLNDVEAHWIMEIKPLYNNCLPPNNIWVTEKQIRSPKLWGVNARSWEKYKQRVNLEPTIFAGVEYFDTREMLKDFLFRAIISRNMLEGKEVPPTLQTLRQTLQLQV